MSKYMSETEQECAIVLQGISCQTTVVYEYIYRRQEEGGAGLAAGLCQLPSISSTVEYF